MPRIINIIKDPHVCSFGDPNKDCRGFLLFNYRCFVENENGEIIQYHFSKFDLTENLNLKDLEEIAQNENHHEIIEGCFDADDLIKMARAKAITDDGTEDTIYDNIIDLVDDLSIAGYDLKNVLNELLYLLYKNKFQKE